MKIYWGTDGPRSESYPPYTSTDDYHHHPKPEGEGEVDRERRRMKTKTRQGSQIMNAGIGDSTYSSSCSDGSNSNIQHDHHHDHHHDPQDDFGMSYFQYQHFGTGDLSGEGKNADIEAPSLNNTASLSISFDCSIDHSEDSKRKSLLQPRSSCEEVVEEQGGDDNSYTSHSSGSSSSSLSTVSELIEDLKYGLPSNMIFFIGSMISFLSSLSDLRKGEQYYANDSYYYYGIHTTIAISDGDGDGDGVYNNSTTHQNDYYYYDDDPYYSSTPYNSFTILGIIASIAFIGNAIIDLIRCYIYKMDYPHIRSIFHEDIRCDYITAMFFGTAACIDLWSSMPFVYNNDVHNRVETSAIISTHLYLFSAFSSLAGTNFVELFYCSGNVAVLCSMTGDLLFLIGSFIDVSIGYISDPELISADPKVLLKLALLSASLWLTDSILYLCGDMYILLQRQQRRRESEQQKQKHYHHMFVNGNVDIPTDLELTIDFHDNDYMAPEVYENRHSII